MYASVFNQVCGKTGYLLSDIFNPVWLRFNSFPNTKQKKKTFNSLDVQRNSSIKLTLIAFIAAPSSAVSEMLTGGPPVCRHDLSLFIPINAYLSNLLHILGLLLLRPSFF